MRNLQDILDDIGACDAELERLNIAVIDATKRRVALRREAEARFDAAVREKTMRPPRNTRRGVMHHPGTDPKGHPESECRIIGCADHGSNGAWQGDAALAADNRGEPSNDP